MRDAGKLIMFLGIGLAIVGAIVYLAPSIPWLGKLPGDIRIERPGVRFYFPIVTCLVLSVILTLVFNLISRLR